MNTWVCTTLGGYFVLYFTDIVSNNSKLQNIHRIVYEQQSLLKTPPVIRPPLPCSSHHLACPVPCLHTCATLKICHPHFSLARNTIGLLLHRPVTNKCSYYIYMYRYLYAQSYKFHCIEHSWFGGYGYGFGLPKFYSQCWTAHTHTHTFL